MRKLLKLGFLLFAGVFFAMCSSEKNKATETYQESEQQEKDYSYVQQKTEKCAMKMETPSGSTICLETAKTPEEREKGLMFRKELPPGQGMIFIFDDDGKKGFWMKNTLIPLDIIFLDKNYAVMKVFANVPPSYIGAQEKDIPAVAWWGRYVLELPGGSSSGYGIHFGTKLKEIHRQKTQK